MVRSANTRDGAIECGAGAGFRVATRGVAVHTLPGSAGPDGQARQELQAI
jgi:hypothetical protein